jgi:uncharacterized protein DUF4129
MIRDILKLLRVLTIFFSLILLTSNAVSGTGDSKINVRRFNDSSIEKYQKSDAFFYLKENNAENNYMDILYKFLGDLLSKVFGNDFSYFIISNFHYVVIVFAIFLILYKIAGLQFIKKSFKSKSINNFDFYEDINDVGNADFEKLISDAIKNRNYRLAIRYHYLNMLKKLTLSGLIEHSPHKTNLEYTYELKDITLRTGFKQIAFIFDYVWYGENNLSDDNYNELLLSFSAFDALLINNQG